MIFTTSIDLNIGEGSWIVIPDVNFCNSIDCDIKIVTFILKYEK